jgi:GT2 family glycosyltransferase
MGKSNAVEISIVIPVYNPPDSFFELLTDLSLQRIDSSHEIIIVDDCSLSDGYSRIKKHIATLDISNIKLLRTPKNLGPAGARNLGSAQATGSVLILIDSDCRIRGRDHLSRMYAAHLQHPHAIIGGGVAGFGKGYAAFSDNYCHWATNIPGTPCTALASGHLVTAHLLIPMAIWEKVGPFDPSLRTGEDTAFCLKARNLNIELRLHGNIYLYHHDRESFNMFVKNFYKVGKDRAAVRKSVYGRVPWYLGGNRLVRCLLVPFITSGLILKLIIKWWPHDKKVLLALPGISLGMLSLAIGVADS